MTDPDPPPAYLAATAALPITPADAVAAVYRAAADAPATLLAYRADPACWRAWCAAEARDALPASPQIVGAYLAALAPRYAVATLRRRLAAIARAHRAAGHHLDAAHPAVRETLRSIARRHGIPQRRAAALATPEVRKLAAACGPDLAGLHDRAMLLLGYAAALRRGELAAVAVEDVRFTGDGIELLLPHSKTDAAGEGARVGYRAASTPPAAVSALGRRPRRISHTTPTKTTLQLSPGPCTGRLPPAWQPALPRAGRARPSGWLGLSRPGRGPAGLRWSLCQLDRAGLRPPPLRWPVPPHVGQGRPADCRGH